MDKLGLKRRKTIEQNYRDGKPHGIWIWWYENKQKKEFRFYENGEPQGLWTYWYKDGTKWAGFYKKEKKHGLWIFLEGKMVASGQKETTPMEKRTVYGLVGMRVEKEYRRKLH